MASNMTVQDIPSKGLALSYADSQKSEDAGPQIIRLDLAQNKLRDILQELKNGTKVSLQTGKQAAVQYGGKKVTLDASAEAFPAEIYHRSEGSGKIYFSGRLSFHLEMSKAREDTAKTDAALANLQSTLSSLKEEQLHNGLTMMGKNGKPSQVRPLQSRKDQLLGSGLSRPSSPFLGSPAPTSNPTLSGSSSKDKIRFEAMKVPVIHLLASRPMSPAAVANKVRASHEDCSRLLDKVAHDSTSNPGKKELKDKLYRELDVWKFPYQKDEDREAAIERSIHALDRSRVEKTDNLWQLLLKPEERGKGKVLSRLNFDRPAPAPKPATIGTKKGDSDGDKEPTKKKSEKKGQLQEPRPVSRATSPAAPKKREPPSKSSASNGKFKSAERVEDSDDDASMIEVSAKRPVKRKEVPSIAPTNRDRTSSPADKKTLHKASVSSSSSASDNSDSSQPQRSLKPPSHDGAPSTRTKHSPRPRHGSSPQKPSPLGSSPPANSTDFDSSSSTTTKGTSQSSAPSSPPSDSEMAGTSRNQKYSPIVREKAQEASQSRPAGKRKQDTDDAPPAKRQQVSASNSKLSHAVTKPMDQPTLKRKVSASEPVSSPEKPAHGREDVIDKAKRFQLYYKKYKTLHDKISGKPEKDRDGKEMESLWEMHKRLRGLKTEIWSNWDRVDSTGTG